jgi:hypothetical protein
MAGAGEAGGSPASFTGAMRLGALLALLAVTAVGLVLAAEGVRSDTCSSATKVATAIAAAATVRPMRGGA